MPTHRQRSFIAEVTAQNGTFHFLDQLHGKPVSVETTAIQQPAERSKITPYFGYMRGYRGFRGRGVSRGVLVGSQMPNGSAHGASANGTTVTRRDESHYLGYRTETVDVPPLHLYFRSVENGYRLYVRSAVRFGTAIFLLSEQCLGAATHESEGRYPNLFHLLNADNRKIDPKAVGDAFSFRLAQPNQNTPFQKRIFKGITHTYISAQGEGPLVLNLRILQRNAAYLSDPDEV